MGKKDKRVKRIVIEDGLVQPDEMCIITIPRSKDKGGTVLYARRREPATLNMEKPKLPRINVMEELIRDRGGKAFGGYVRKGPKVLTRAERYAHFNMAMEKHSRKVVKQANALAASEEESAHMPPSRHVNGNVMAQQDSTAFAPNFSNTMNSHFDESYNNSRGISYMPGRSEDISNVNDGNNFYCADNLTSYDDIGDYSYAENDNLYGKCVDECTAATSDNLYGKCVKECTAATSDHMTTFDDAIENYENLTICNAAMENYVPEGPPSWQFVPGEQKHPRKTYTIMAPDNRHFKQSKSFDFDRDPNFDRSCHSYEMEYADLLGGSCLGGPGNDDYYRYAPPADEKNYYSLFDEGNNENASFMRKN